MSSDTKRYRKLLKVQNFLKKKEEAELHHLQREYHGVQTRLEKIDTILQQDHAAHRYDLTALAKNFQTQEKKSTILATQIRQQTKQVAQSSYRSDLVKQKYQTALQGLEKRALGELLEEHLSQGIVRDSSLR